jgi:hypothetical protein
LATAAAVAGGGVVMGISAFAFPLFAGGALAVTRPPATVIPAVMLLADAMMIALLVENRAALQGRQVWRLPIFRRGPILAAGAGLLVGTTLLAASPPRVLRAGLAATTILAGLLALGQRRLGSLVRGSPGAGTRSRDGSVACLTGLVSGILQGWIGVGGVPVLVYLLWRSVEREAFLAAGCLAFLSVDFLRSVDFVVRGALDRQTLQLVVEIAPLALGGFVVGAIARRYWIPRRRFHTAVALGLIATGVALGAEAWR